MYLLTENSKYVDAYYTFKCNPCCFPVEEKIQRAVLLIQGVPESQSHNKKDKLYLFFN